MSQSLVGCPLCCQATFSSTNSLCLALITVASKNLKCPLCEEIVYGLDKLTIHLMNHLLTQQDRQIEKKHLSNSSERKVEERFIPNFESLIDNCEYIETGSKDEEKSFKSLINNKKINRKCNTFTQNMVIDNEILLVFDKTKIQENLLEPFSDNSNECSRNSLQNPPNFTLSENVQSNNINTYNSELYYKENLIQNGIIPECKVIEKPLLNVKHFETTDTQLQFPNQVVGPTISDTLGITCQECPTKFSNNKMLSMHQDLVHSSKKPEEKKNFYSCKQCTKSFKMKGSLNVHNKVAHSSNAIALSRLMEVTRKTEMSNSNDNSPYNCSTCGKGFKKEQHLIQHEKTHEGKQWDCKDCGKTFTTKYFLKKHHLLHTGETPYTCTMCNKSFTFQQSYHKHLLYHSDDKPYHCSECGRSFKELSTLHNHQRIHTGEKPYSCETCGQYDVSFINTLISALTL